MAEDPPAAIRPTPTPGTPWAVPSAVVPSVPATVPVAWLGRTSDEDAQDPTLSLPRQLSNARKALPPNWVIVAHFYDVESGRKALDQRGHSLAHERFNIPIPRDGGIASLLTEAARPDRRFAAVICESIERVARRTYYGTKVEHELESHGVALCAADEPISTDGKAKRATPTLTRRVKQAVAEWYVLQMLELSWDGFVEHTNQGWNIGKPPYGYLADRVPHPVPARRAEGRTKHRLIPDPVRGPVVTWIFQLRGLAKLSYNAIAQVLDSRGPEICPPPSPTRADMTIGHWTASAVRGILENPKYTGYQVWNRKARKKGNTANHISEWIWSPHPVHEPLVTRELFDAATSLGTSGRREQAQKYNTAAHPAQSEDHDYPLRSYIVCALCGHRMSGKLSKGRPYYACQPKRDHNKDAEWYSTHPKAVWISERPLLQAVQAFFTERILGPDRAELLRADLATISKTPESDHTERLGHLRSTVTELERRKDRLLDQLAEPDEDDPETAKEFRRGIRKRYEAAEKRRRELLTEISKFDTPTEQSTSDPDILGLLPQLGLSWGHIPIALQRQLFDAFQLRMTYHGPDRNLAIEATVRPGLAEELSKVVLAVTAKTDGEHREGLNQPFSECPQQDSNLRPSA